jgi:hypothetical protein
MHNNVKYPVLVLCLLLWAGQTQARLQDKGWIFTPTVGMSGPQLSSLNDGLFLTPLSGQAEITTDLPEDVEGASAYPTERFTFHNPLQPVWFWWEAGIEARRNFGRKNDFFVGISTWEANSASQIEINFPLQGAVGNTADYTRRSSFSYTQYFVGLRRYLFERANRFNLYLNFSIHDLFDIDYKDKHVFDYTSGPPKGFSRIMIFQTQATGLLLLQFGAGAEVRLADRFSIGIDGSYALGVKDATLKDVSVKEDFNDGDRLTVFPEPIRETEGGNFIEYLSQDGKNYEQASFRLDGWRVQLKFNIAF